jgi:ASC-1-like (ASCH) protein/NTP pyrophosphatase (non-canonical NTP hydrolase)
MEHLAVFSQGVIELILAGEKTVEGRLAKFRSAPFKRVKKGDVVFMKESGGLVKGKFRVRRVIFAENITAAKMKDLRRLYERALAMPDSFWRAKAKAKFATLIFIAAAVPLDNPLSLEKHDKRSWVVLPQVVGTSSRTQLALRFSDRDSLSSLTQLVRLARQEKGLRTKESGEEFCLALAAAVGSLADSLAKKKPQNTFPQELAAVLIELIKISDWAGVDLFRVTKEQIQKPRSKISLTELDKLK